MATNEDCIDKEHTVAQEDAKQVDYLSEYRKFYEKFADIGESCDQLPVKVVGCLSISENEIPGEILSYTLQYLDSIECPPGLIGQICREVLEDTRKTLQNETCNVTSLSLMRAAVSSVHHCLQAGLDNEKACRLAKPPEAPRSTASASRNGLRCMEDRHVTLDDLSVLVDSQDKEPCSFYAVYDGHSGPLAAAYSAAQLHMHFINSEYFKSNPQYALKEAFIKTDAQFGTKKSTGGTTAVVSYLKGNNVIVGWAGDSQALLVGDGSLIQLVNPHKPSREDERKRIKQLGGQVIYNGIWRVNGILAVSRAIGDTLMKPYVISEPEFASVKLSGFEEFIVLACDGLWDFVTEDDVALEVYKAIEKYADDIKKISDHLVKVAKIKGSVDNISVIVVFLQDINKLAEKAKWLLKKFATMDASFDNTGGAQTNRFLVNSNQETPFSKEGLVFDLETGFRKQNGGDSEPDVDPFSQPTNGKGSPHHMENEMEDDEDDEDLGPETDVDAVDDVIMSPSLAAARALSQGSGTACNDIVDLLDGIGAQRQETPTPPVDAEADADYGGSALVENVGESGGEDSDEDEWNYFKGDKKERSNIEDPLLVPEKDNQELDTEDFVDDREDNMSSPLNPDAPPFVPVLPGGNTEAPVLPQRLFSEEVVAQSPQKPVPMDDIKVPEPREFEDEIAHRLADLGDDNDYHNGHSDNSAMSSQENLKETLQGNEKQLGDGDHVELQLSATSETSVDQAEFDRVQKDTTDFCDIQVTYNQQTNQSYDDEGIDEELYERLKNKERDPMSMSFYQEKDLDTCEEGHNPFDLNAVQMVPNDLEEFCNDKPQAEIPSTFDTSNPFLENTQDSEITQREIHAAISDLDNAVTNESDSMDSVIKAPSPLMFEKANVESPEVKELISPISDNVSQMTEPSEHDAVDQQELLNVEEHDPAVISHDSAFSADAPSPVPSPMETDVDICQSTQPELFIQQPELVTLAPEPVDYEQFLQPEPTESQAPVPEFFDNSEKPMKLADDFLSQVENVPNPIFESHMEDISNFIEQPSEHIENRSVIDSLVEQAEPRILDVEFTTKPHIEDSFENQSHRYDEFVSNSVVEDLCQTMQFTNLQSPIEMQNKFEEGQEIVQNEFEKVCDTVSDIITDMQGGTDNIQSNIIDFRNDIIENNVTNETSHTEVIEDITEKKIENIESSPIECLIDNAIVITNEPSSHVMPEFMDVEPQIKAVSDPIEQLEQLKTDPEPVVSTEVDILPVAGAVIGAVAGAAVVASIAEPEDKKTPKPKTATTKKAPATKPATSPTKTSAPKITASSTTAKKPLSAPLKNVSATKTPATTAPKSAPPKPKTLAPTTRAPAPKPATTTTASPKPRTTLGTKTAALPSDKKPLTNGDVKREPIKKATPLTKPAAPKPSVPKTTSTVLSKTSPTAPKPSGVAAKAPVSKTPLTRPTTAPAAPRPKPAPISKAPLGKPSSAPLKTSTVDKSVKETANKQISARPTPAPRTALTSRPDPKTTSKTTTKTTTTTTATKPLPIRRPTSATATTKTTATKTTSKNSTTTVKGTVKNVTTEKLNGDVEKCVKEIHETQEIITNGTTDIPLKDDSPQQMDNSLVPIIDAAAD